MQQVKPTGFRLGSVTGGKDSIWRKSRNAALIAVEIGNLLSKALNKSGAMVLNHYNYPARQQSFLSCVNFYLFQRSRLPRGLVRRLNKRHGALATPMSREFMLYHSDFKGSYAKHYASQGRLQAVPKPGIKGYNAESRRSGNLRGGVDLELNSLFSQKRHKLDTTERFVRDKITPYIGRSNVRAHNFNSLVESVNPKRALKHYTLKRFQELLYRTDLIRAIYAATQVRSALLVAKIIQFGLERHAAVRGQKYFLKLVRLILERVTLWEEVDRRVIWFIEISGKLDAKMRRQSVSIKGDEMESQGIDFKISEANVVAKTKFGTSNILVTMRDFD